MKNIIGTFKCNRSQIIFTVYDDYTYRCSTWPQDHFSEIKLTDDGVMVRHYDSSSYVSIDSSESCGLYKHFVQNIHEIYAEYDLLLPQEKV